MSGIHLLHLIVLVGLSSSLAGVNSPLFYRTFAMGEIRARVQQICMVEVPPRGAHAQTSIKKPSPDSSAAQVQVVSLEILEIDQFTREAGNVPGIVEGQVLEIINPYPERSPSLRAGMEIKARIRLVLPEEQFNPDDPRRQWWFNPPGAEKSISPPPDPANAIVILSSSPSRRDLPFSMPNLSTCRKEMFP